MIFINDIEAITSLSNTDKPEKPVSSPINAIEPSYKGLIKMSLLRRMSKLVRMGVGVGLPLLERNSVDAIIFGSGNGSAENSLKFINQIIDYDEGTLTPTNFVQSTSNAVAGTLALMGRVTGYNNTHVNQGLSFESALLDAVMLLEDYPNKSVLLGAGEEMSEANYNIDKRRGVYKETFEDDLYNSTTKGYIPGEGVAGFVVSGEKSEKSICGISEVAMLTSNSLDDVSEWLNDFLSRINIENLDALVSGACGDSSSNEFFQLISKRIKKPEFHYKEMFGEFYTASALSVYLTTKKFQSNLFLGESFEGNNVLLYNCFEGRQHSLVLMHSL